MNILINLLLLLSNASTFANHKELKITQEASKSPRETIKTTNFLKENKFEENLIDLLSAESFQEFVVCPRKDELFQFMVDQNYNLVEELRSLHEENAMLKKTIVSQHHELKEQEKNYENEIQIFKKEVKDCMEVLSMPKFFQKSKEYNATAHRGLEKQKSKHQVEALNKESQSQKEKTPTIRMTRSYFLKKLATPREPEKTTTPRSLENTIINRHDKYLLSQYVLQDEILEKQSQPQNKNTLTKKMGRTSLLTKSATPRESKRTTTRSLERKITQVCKQEAEVLKKKPQSQKNKTSAPTSPRFCKTSATSKMPKKSKRFLTFSNIHVNQIMNK